MPLRSFAAAVMVAMSVTACSDDAAGDGEAPDAPIVQLGAPGETSRVLTGDEAEAIETPTHTQADIDFVHGMIAHHQQALEMTALVTERSELDDLDLLAERMDVSQGDEVAQMQDWLLHRGVLLPDGDDHAAHTGPMPGMLTADELDELRTASGTRFDRLFLESMIRHHQGAVAMVEALLTGGEGGQEPQVFQLAQGLSSDQHVEISRMLALLDDVDP